MAGSSTSPLGAGIATQGLQLLVGNASSPETFEIIANATDLKVPTLSEVVDVTNFGDLWRRRMPTLLDMGKITFKIFWVMEDPSHNNSTPYGLRYLLINRILRDWQISYPPGNVQTDAFPAYVTQFEVTAAVGKDFEASIELSNSGAPSLV
ncbi:MAG TPA: phage tail tube protein [Candidatus Sulfotelmatobacter sp.]|nr:phage tail tube protein [Candidatus Sulfotelmatobacter sp.]